MAKIGPSFNRTIVVLRGEMQCERRSGRLIASDAAAHFLVIAAVPARRGERFHASAAGGQLPGAW
jgi:hypothetical protein